MKAVAALAALLAALPAALPAALAMLGLAAVPPARRLTLSWAWTRFQRDSSTIASCWPSWTSSL